MKTIMPFLIAVTAILAINTATAQSKTKTAPAGIEVIQFHSEHRCVTCLKIEKMTKATLAKSFPAMPFKLINADDKANAKIAAQFEASGTGLFLYNPKTGAKKDLTSMAFMKAGKEDAFDAELKKNIDEFLKG